MRNALIRSIRKGQRDGTYLVVSKAVAEYWKLHYSPFGCVEKADADPDIEARVIHDLSSPAGSSTNAWSDQDDIPKLVYELVDVIARRIIELKITNPSLLIKLVKGDVNSAYKNLDVHEVVSAYFAGTIHDEDVVVIDLALPFGWTSSAAHYGVFGKAISFLVRHESPNSLNPSDPDAALFFCYDWVDDHGLVEHDTGNRLAACDSALQLAMVAVLGPRSINNKKFTEWSTALIALGLEWDSVAMTVSMPDVKIQKALRRIEGVLASLTTTRTTLSKLLGSLRHVCSCIRPAKAFFQRLVTLWKRSPRSRPIKVSRAARLDLEWFSHILLHGRLRGVPLEYFRMLPDPAVHLYMDASNSGLCVLDPARHEFIRIQFDAVEQRLIETNEFSINVREQFSALLAVLIWGKHWQTTKNISLTHIRFWIDNAAAVAWCNNLSSTNPLAQEMNRILGAAEAEWDIRVSAEHLAGPSNYLADLGSRAWSEPQITVWSGLTTNWSQATVPDRVRKSYDGNWSPFNYVPSPTPPEDSTTPHGSSGLSSVTDSAGHLGYHNKIVSSSLFNWCFSPSTDGHHQTQPTRHDLFPPFTPSLAMSNGIIRCSPDLNQQSIPAMPQHSGECGESALLHNQELPSQLPCSSGSQTESTTRTPATASFLGLRSWVSFIS